jgi:TRAP-type C4-dicarboxylate transport system substrate-binding protein
MRFQWGFSLIALVIVSMSVVTGVAGATQLKIATVAPEGSGWMQSMRLAAGEIKSKTNGRVEIKFYAGGVMGNDKKVLRKIRIGQLQGGVFTANGLSERYRDILIYGLPLVFRTQEEADYVRERMDPLLTQGLDDSGFVSFGFAGGGFAKLMGNEPIGHLDDLRGRKVWVPEGDTVSYEAMVALNLAPVVLPITDVLMGLQTGLLEYIATPPVGAVILQWFTKVKYVSNLPLVYTLATMVIDKRAFSSISDVDQATVREILTAVYDDFDSQNKEDNLQAEEALAANGLKFIDLQPEIIASWREAARQANEKMAEKGLFSKDLLNALLSYVEEYRIAAKLQAASASGTE